MKKILYGLPWFLLYSRIVIAAFFFATLTFLDFYGIHFKLYLFLFCFGFIGDIFDGVIARKLNMDTTLLRRLDSLFDTFFWLASTCLVYKSSPGMPVSIFYGLGAMIAFVAMEYIFCLMRFGKSPSAHNFLSKFFGLFLFFFYVLVFAGYIPVFFGTAVIIF